MLVVVVSVAVVVLLANCSVSTPERSDRAGRTVREAAAELRERAYFADRVDRSDATDAALAATPSSDDVADAYAGLRLLLAELADGHAALVPNPDALTEDPRGLELPSAERFGDVVVLSLPAVAVQADSPAWHAYADAGLATLSIHADACGFVVDLRHNGGGTVSPMLAATGPLLGEGTRLRYVDRDDDELASYGWTGTSIIGNTSAGTEAAISTSLATALDLADTPVAVLTGPITASAGEAVVIAFTGLQDTITMGRSTRGVPTGVGSIEVGNGSQLRFAEAAAADRTGHVYDAALPPDQMVPTQLPAIRAAAFTWLSETAGCHPS